MYRTIPVIIFILTNVVAFLLGRAVKDSILGTSPCPTQELRQAMELATKFRREGDISLDIYLKDAIKDGVTDNELDFFYKLADAAERRIIIDSFTKDNFQYLDKDGISHTYPKGYIQR